jgi:acetylornithine deacetylase/succinyl-diaminopimelate desuccinylase-like protein
MKEQHRTDQHRQQRYLSGSELRTLIERQQRATPSTTVTMALRHLLQGAGLHILDEAATYLLVSPSLRPESALLLYIHYDDTALQAQQAWSIAVTLAAIERCRQNADAEELSLLWLLDGSRDQDTLLPVLMERHALLRQARGCLWDGTGQIGIELDRPAIVLGSKGVLRVALEVQTARYAVERQHSVLVPNALWRLTWALHAIKDAHADIHLPGFYEAVRSPEENELAALYTLPDTSTLLAQRWGMEHLLFTLHGFQQHFVHLLTPDCTLLDLCAERFAVEGDDDSAAGSYLPTRARALLEFTLVPAQEPAIVLQQLQQYLHEQGFADITVRLLYARPPAITGWQHPFTQQVWQASIQVYGDRLLLLPCTVGSLPMTLLAHEYGLPCVLIMPGNEACFEESIQQLSFLIVK